MLGRTRVHDLSTCPTVTSPRDIFILSPPGRISSPFPESNHKTLAREGKMATKLKIIDKIYLLCVFSFIVLVVFSAVSGDSGPRAEPEEKAAPFWLSRIGQSSRNYWAKLAETLGRGHSYFFPPKIDFSGKGEATGGGGSSTAGEKVKEAAAKSFEKSKETVDEAARSTAETVKKIFSGEEPLRAEL
ncbi:PREDICTED: uncharacterized protein LOC104808101 isoform X2 [Tarenaya hassleriana]|uniref:uncharacterized protein LOC104808101 isoform X2 n=1 Tax=Tarenaya hassleriana TaxID=28532 RepID=UPI00053CA17B|nr:PREDICTED: uncharacterized protein LOC104808101 isoform X2 [Tarenaya hassleriana]